MLPMGERVPNEQYPPANPEQPGQGQGTPQYSLPQQQPGYMPPQYQPYPQQPGAQPYPPAGYMGPPPGYLQYGQPPRRSRAGWIAGIIAGVLLLCVIACGGVAYAINSAAQGFNSSILPKLMATETALAQTGGRTVTYQDTMTNFPQGWPNDAQCKLAADGYHLTGGALCLNPAISADDGVTITVVTQITRTSASTQYGIVFRETTKNDYYAFVITSDGRWIIYKMASGTATTLVGGQALDTLLTGKDAINTLEVDLMGTTFTCSVNSKQVGSATDDTFASGSTGVVNHDIVKTSEVVFTSFSVAQNLGF